MNAFEEAFIDKGIEIGKKRGFKEGRTQTLKENLQNLKINLLETGLCKTKDEAELLATELLNDTKSN